MSDEDHSEIYRVNKLLAIEDLDWKLQLEKAVSFYSGLDLDLITYNFPSSKEK